MLNMMIGGRRMDAYGMGFRVGMDELSLILIPVLLLLALVVGSVLGWVAHARTRELKTRLDVLTMELARLRAIVDPTAPPLAAQPFTVPTETPEQAARRPIIPGPYGHVPEPPVPEPAAAPDVEQAEAAPTTPDEAPAADAAHSSTDAAQAPDSDGMSPPAALPAAAERSGGMEEAIGSRWAVWVGGLALALGAIFLVRYSIEAGLLGPGARILLGLLFSGLLLAAGEALRRREAAEPPADLRRAYIPGVLTAAGTIAGFAAVYAAYALYGFIGDLAAFIALGLVAIATLALALLHGPGLAGLGLAASYATPLLVSSDAPNLGALVLYLLVVTVAALRVAWLKAWRWLAITAVIGQIAWAFVMLATNPSLGFDAPVIAAHIALTAALTIFTFAVSVHPRDPGTLVPNDRVGTGLLALFILPVFGFLAVFVGEGGGLALAIGLAAALVVTAYEWPAFRLAALATVILQWLAYAALVTPVDPMTFAVDGPTVPVAFSASTAIVGAAVMGLFFAGLGLFAVLGSASRVPQAVAGVLGPLGLLVLAYLRVTEFTISLPFGLAALLVAFLFAAVTEALVRRLDPEEFGVDAVIAAYALGSVAALALGFTMMLEKGVLTLALAMIVPAIAWIEARRPVAGLRPIAVTVSTLVAARFAFDPAVVGTDLGTTPVFNWLLYGYGVPAAAFAAAAWRFARTREDRFVPIFEALAVAFTTLTLVMLIHHAKTGGDLYAAVSGLSEQSLIVMSLLAVSLGLQWLAVRRPSSPVFTKGTLVLGALGLIMGGVGLVIVHNPVLTAERIEGGFFDGTLLLGYLLPAVMAFAVAAVAHRRPDRPVPYVALAGSLGGLLAFLWVTLAVRAVFSPGELAMGSVGETELYVYSAVWLLAGILVLVAGVVLKSRPIRQVSAVLVGAVVVKIFLFDTVGLTGALRALSFIGLGVVLIFVGLAYQKFLAKRA